MGTQPKEWVKWLSLAEWWYNTSCHSASSISPFEVVYGYSPPKVVYGYSPPRLTSYVKGIAKVKAVDEILKSRDQISKALKENLEFARHRMNKLIFIEQKER